MSRPVRLAAVSERIRVAVIGAAGRMGSTVCQAVQEADDMDLVGRFDVGDDLGDLGNAQAVVEFSVPDASIVASAAPSAASSRSAPSASVPPPSAPAMTGASLVPTMLIDTVCVTDPPFPSLMTMS